MSAFTKTLFKPFAALLTMVLGTPGGPAEGSTRLAAMSMPSLIKLLREDASVRQRFARDPRGVLREAAIDEVPFLLPSRIDGAWLDRFLADWAGRTGPRALTPVAVERPYRQAFSFGGPPAPVYGPPPAPRPVPPPDPPVEAQPPPEPPVVTPRPPEPQPEPSPAPVYGPPPGRFPSR